MKLSPKTYRYDSSLALLTKKFIEQLLSSKSGGLDLKRVAAKLKVQKRRIYDITNVLEGIGLIEKNSKNHVQWIGERSELKNRYLSLKYQNECLKEEFKQLNDLKHKVDLDIEHQLNAPSCYLAEKLADEKR